MDDKKLYLIMILIILFGFNIWGFEQNANSTSTIAASLTR